MPLFTFTSSMMRFAQLCSLHNFAEKRMLAVHSMILLQSVHPDALQQSGNMGGGGHDSHSLAAISVSWHDTLPGPMGAAQVASR